MNWLCHRWLQWTVLLTVALAVRLVAATWWQSRIPAGQQFALGDSQTYWALGLRIAHGQSYQYATTDLKIFRTPGYPLVLAGLFAVAGDDPPVLWARAINGVLGCVAVAGVGWLAAQLFDQRTALVAGGLTAVYPSALAMSTFVLSEAAFCPLMLAQLSCWIAAERHRRQQPSTSNGLGRQIGRSWPLYLLAGTLAGLATLVRPSWSLFTPLAILASLALGPDRRQGIVAGFWLMVGLVLTMSPWWIRNYQVAGAFVPTTLQTGASLYDGLNPRASGGSNMDFVPEFWDQQRRFDRQAAAPLQGTFEQRVDDRMRNAAVGWATDNTGAAVRLAGVKLLRMWGPWPTASSLGSWKMKLLVAAGYVPLMLAAIAGTWLFVRRGWPWQLCLMPAIYFTMLHVVFVSSIRYRQPPMLPLIVLAAGFLTHLVPANRTTAESDEPQRSETQGHDS